MASGPRRPVVAVVGVGLIGGSIGLAARERAGALVRGWDTRDGVLATALERGALTDACGSLAEALEGASVAFVAVPVGALPGTVADVLAAAGEDCVVTDVGSTKRSVVAAVDDPRFVGGHPLAGAETAGVEHARADLFDGAPYVLTSTEDGSDPAALAALEETLASVGASVRVMTAREHDRALALVSHLPQLLSSALASTVGDQPDAAALLGLSGSGFRDVTRLAASPWSVWRDILATNPREVASALDQLLDKLTAERDELRQLSDGGQSLEATAALFNTSRQ